MDGLSFYFCFLYLSATEIDLGVYFSAVPGKVSQALVRAEAENQLVVTDEVNAIKRGINGDPTSSLLDMDDTQQSSGYSWSTRA
jgi:ATP-dependent Lon protease